MAGLEGGCGGCARGGCGGSGVTRGGGHTRSVRVIPANQGLLGVLEGGVDAKRGASRGGLGMRRSFEAVRKELTEEDPGKMKWVLG